MSKLLEIIDNIPIVHQFGCPALERSDGGLMDYTCTCGNTRKAAKQIKALMLELIGDDSLLTSRGSANLHWQRVGSNATKQTLRRKVEQL